MTTPAAPIEAPVAAPAAAPAAAAEPASLGNFSFENQLDSLWDQAVQPEAEPAAQPAEAAQPAQAAPAEPPAKPAAEAATKPAEETPEPEIDLEGLEADSVSEDGNRHWFSKSKADRLLRARDFQKAVQDKVPGATPEAVAQLYDSHVKATQMIADYDSGDPSRVENVVQFFVESPNAQSPALLLNGLVGALEQKNPQAVQALETGMLNKAIDRWYREANQRNDDQLFLVAQHLDKLVNGHFLEKQQFAAKDPATARAEQLERELSQYRERDQRNLVAQRQAWAHETDQAVRAQVDGLIEAALKPVEHLKGQMEWDVAVAKVRAKVEEAAKANSTWSQQFDIERQNAVMHPSDQARGRLALIAKQFAEPIIRRARNAVLESLTGKVLATNQAVHQQKTVEASRQEPGGGGVPVQAGNVLDRMREAKTYDEKVNELFRTA